jgi:hypothetical protein
MKKIGTSNLITLKKQAAHKRPFRAMALDAIAKSGTGG